MEPPKGLFEPVSFIQLESDYRLKSEKHSSQPVGNSGKAGKREWVGWAADMRKRITKILAGKKSKKRAREGTTMTASSAVKKSKKRADNGTVSTTRGPRELIPRRTRGRGRGRGRGAARLSATRGRGGRLKSSAVKQEIVRTVKRERPLGSMEDTEIEGWDSVKMVPGKQSFFLPPSRIGGVLAAWDFLVMHSTILSLNISFSHRQLISGLRSLSGSILIESIFEALLKVVYRVDSSGSVPSQRHIVITRLTWPHYLRLWLMNRDTWDMEDFNDVSDWLSHSSFYSLQFSRRCDVLISLVDEVNSHSLIRKTLVRNLSKIAVMKTAVYKKTALKRKEEKSLKSDTSHLHEVALCLSDIMNEVAQDKVDRSVYASQIGKKFVKKMFHYYEEDRKKREKELELQINTMPVRTVSLGSDRYRRDYYCLGGSKSHLYVCDAQGVWSFYDSRKSFKDLLSSLNRLGHREFSLYKTLTSIEWKFPDDKKEAHHVAGQEQLIEMEGVSPVDVMADFDPDIFYQYLLDAELKIMRASHALAVHHASEVVYHRCDVCQEAVGDDEHHCSRCHLSFQKGKCGDDMFREHIQKCAFDSAKSRQILTDLASLPPAFQVCKALLLDLEAAVPIDACHDSESSDERRREIWIDQAKISTGVDELVDLLAPVEAGVLDEWLRPWFKRNDWRLELSSCRTPHSFAASLLAFDKALLFSEEEYHEYHSKLDSSSVAQSPFEEEQSEDFDDDEDDSGGCRSCGESTKPDKLLICDGCNDEYHTFCLNPPLSAVPEGDWHCPKCLSASKTHDQSSAMEHVPSRLLSFLEHNESAYSLPRSIMPHFKDQVQKDFFLDFSQMEQSVLTEIEGDLSSADADVCKICLTSDTLISMRDCSSCSTRFHLSCLSDVALKRAQKNSVFVCSSCSRKSEIPGACEAEGSPQSQPSIATSQ